MKLGLLLLLLVALPCLTISARADSTTTTVDIVISPSTVYLGSNGTWVTVHAGIPYSQVAGATVTLDGIPVVYTKSDNRGELVAKFNLDDVKARLTPGNLTLVVSGWTIDDDAFEGSDEICVKAGGAKK